MKLTGYIILMVFIGTLICLSAWAPAMIVKRRRIRIKKKIKRSICEISTIAGIVLFLIFTGKTIYTVNHVNKAEKILVTMETIVESDNSETMERIYNDYIKEHSGVELQKGVSGNEKYSATVITLRQTYGKVYKDTTVLVECKPRM